MQASDLMIDYSTRWEVRRKRRRIMERAKMILAFIALALVVGVALLPLWLEAPQPEMPLPRSTFGHPLGYDAMVVQSGPSEQGKPRFYSRKDHDGKLE